MPIEGTPPEGKSPSRPKEYKSTVQAWNRTWTVIYRTSDSTVTMDQIAEKLNELAQKIFQEVEKNTQTFDREQVQGIGCRMENGQVVFNVKVGEETKKITRVATKTDQLFQAFQTLGYPTSHVAIKPAPQIGKPAATSQQDLENEKKDAIDRLYNEVIKILEGDEKVEGKDRATRFEGLLDQFVKDNPPLSEKQATGDTLKNFKTDELIRDYVKEQLQIKVKQNQHKLLTNLESIILPPKK